MGIRVGDQQLDRIAVGVADCRVTASAALPSSIILFKVRSVPKGCLA
jgi:hypothetical protein